MKQFTFYINTLAFFLFSLYPQFLSAQKIDTTLASQWYQDAIALQEEGLFAEAVPLFTKAEADFYKAYLQKQDTKTAVRYFDCRLNKGTCLRKLGNYDESVNLHQESLSQSSELLGAKHPTSAKCHNAMGRTFGEMHKLDKAEVQYQEALSINLEAFGENHQATATTYNHLGLLSLRKQRFDKALDYFTKALSIFEGLSQDVKSSIADTYYYIGIIHNFKGNQEACFSSFNKSYELHKEIYGEDHIQVSVIMDALGTVYWEGGKLERSLYFLTKSLEIKLSKFGEDHNNLGATYNNLGNLYDELGAYDQAIEYLEKALKIRKRDLGEDNPRLSRYYNNLGIVYQHKGQLDRALDYQLKSLKLKKLQSKGKETADIGEALHNIGSIYQAQNKPREALPYFEKSLKIWLEEYGENYYLVGAAYTKQGAIYTDLKLWDKAMAFQEKALALRKRIYGEGHPLVAATLESIGRIFKEQEDWARAMTYYDQALNSLDKMRENYSSEAIKQYFVEKNFRLFEEALFVLHQQYRRSPDPIYLESAFKYFEKSKSLNLLESLNEVDALKFGELPQKVLKEEQQWSEGISELENQISEAIQSGKPENDSLVLATQVELLEKKEGYKTFVQSLEQKYPRYYQLKYDFVVPALNKVQQDLANQNQGLIEYFVGQDQIYVLLITPDSERFLVIDQDQDLKQQINLLIESTYQYFIGGTKDQAIYERSLETWTQTAQQLYKNLFAPLEQEGVLPERLIIVSDDVLGYLPFEFLIKTMPEDQEAFGNYTFLLKDYQISYAYSIKLLEQMQDRSDPRKSGRLIGYAPSFDEQPGFSENRSITEIRQSLHPLIYNVKEVKVIQELMGGETFINENATKESFLSNAPNYSIIHLATHGKADDNAGDFAYLAFTKTDEKEKSNLLYNRELYDLNLNAELVVLSACETALGELKSGEGIISLARGFSYAGAQSIITSLWSVNDGRTQQLMESFYKHLKKGQSKDAALRQAKLDFITKNGTGAHPFYWAGFIAVGNMEPIQLGGTKKWKNIGLMVLVMLGGFFFLSRRGR